MPFGNGQLLSLGSGENPRHWTFSSAEAQALVVFFFYTCILKIIRCQNLWTETSACVPKASDNSFPGLLHYLGTTVMRACSAYDQFLLRGNLLTEKLMSQEFQMSRLQAAFRKFYGRYNILFTHTTFLWATCCLIRFITIVKPFLTLILTTVHNVYLIWRKGSRRVWSIYRGCLLLHGTWSHPWYIRRSVYAYSLICISFWIYEIEYCSLFLSFHRRI
jgi:hypothetical protein